MDKRFNIFGVHIYYYYYFAKRFLQSLLNSHLFTDQTLADGDLRINQMQKFPCFSATMNRIDCEHKYRHLRRTVREHSFRNYCGWHNAAEEPLRRRCRTRVHCTVRAAHWHPQCARTREDCRGKAEGSGVLEVSDARAPLLCAIAANLEESHCAFQFRFWLAPQSDFQPPLDLVPKR